MKRFSYHQTNHIWIESCYARRFVHTSYNSYPHPTHEMGWGRGRDGDVMYMNACYCYILVHVFYYCLFITVLHSSSWWVCKLGPHCFSSYTWSTSTLFLIIHMIKVPVLINSNSRYRMSQMILLKVNYKYKFKKIT